MKKIIYLLVMAVMYAFVSCGDNGTDIDIRACGKHNPNWLVKKIREVENRGKEKRPVYVFAMQYNTQEYILICDPVNSSAVDGQLLYSCDGQFVNPEESLYKNLITLFNEEERVLLWNN